MIMRPYRRGVRKRRSPGIHLEQPKLLLRAQGQLWGSQGFAQRWWPCESCERHCGVKLPSSGTLATTQSDCLQKGELFRRFAQQRRKGFNSSVKMQGKHQHESENRRENWFFFRTLRSFPNELRASSFHSLSMFCGLGAQLHSFDFFPELIPNSRKFGCRHSDYLNTCVSSCRAPWIWNGIVGHSYELLSVLIIQWNMSVIRTICTENITDIRIRKASNMLFPWAV